MRKSLIFGVMFSFVCFLSCKSVGSGTYNNYGTENTDIISKLAPHADYSYFQDQELSFDEESQELDVRSYDLSNKDLSKYNGEQISFDDGTIFPTNRSKLPTDFNREVIRETHKNPGLNVRQLHTKGVDGRGMSMAIIDSILSSHVEYNDNLVYYEKFLCNQQYSCDYGYEGGMHGSAVASIAVGKTVGVAPKAKLYYFAADITDRQFTDDETKKRTSKYFAQALDKIVEINKTLPDDQKIVVVSVSAAPSWSRDPELWNASLQKAKQAGIFVTTTSIQKEYGLWDNGTYRGVSLDPDNFDSYSQTNWQKGNDPTEEVQKNTLCFPMDHRTTAAPNGNDYYVHYANGGWSWMKPFEAGIYLLAKQVKPSITPKEFFKVGLQTGYYSKKAQCMIVDPMKLIQTL